MRLVLLALVACAALAVAAVMADHAHTDAATLASHMSPADEMQWQEPMMVDSLLETEASQEVRGREGKQWATGARTEQLQGNWERKREGR